MRFQKRADTVSDCDRRGGAWDRYRRAFLCDPASCSKVSNPDEQSLAKVGITPQMLKGRKIYRGAGCPACLNTGYAGRTGIFELLIVNEAIQNLILKTSDSNAIKQKAIQNGMVTLRQNGAQKVLNGITTIEEVFRVTYQ